MAARLYQDSPLVFFGFLGFWWCQLITAVNIQCYKTASKIVSNIDYHNTYYCLNYQAILALWYRRFPLFFFMWMRPFGGSKWGSSLNCRTILLSVIRWNEWREVKIVSIYCSFLEKDTYYRPIFPVEAILIAIAHCHHLSLVVEVSRFLQ